MFKALLAKFFPGPTPAKDNLRDELRARQIRNEVPLDYYARTIEATPDQLHEAKIHYRDQLDVGTDPQVAMYRAKVHMGSIKSRDARWLRHPGELVTLKLAAAVERMKASEVQE